MASFGLNASIWNSTISDASGAYQFITPVEGSYFVDVSDRNGALLDWFHTIGPQSISDPSPAIPLASGDIYTRRTSAMCGRPRPAAA